MIEPFTWLSVAATAWLFKPVRFRFLIRHAIQTHLPPPNHCRWYPSPRGDFVDVQLFVLPLWHLYLYPWALDPVVLCPLDVLLLLLSEQPQSPCGPEQNRAVTKYLLLIILPPFLRFSRRCVPNAVEHYIYYISLI